MTRPHARYPQVELPEDEFEQLLDVVDALDQTQLLRLYCKVGSLISGDQEAIVGARVGDTIPPSVSVRGSAPVRASLPATLSKPPASGYVDLEIDWSDVDVLTEPGDS